MGGALGPRFIQLLPVVAGRRFPTDCQLGIPHSHGEASPGPDSLSYFDCPRLPPDKQINGAQRPDGAPADLPVSGHPGAGAEKGKYEREGEGKGRGREGL